MPRNPHPPRVRWVPALALLGTLALPASARADFEVTYLFTDSDGDPLANARLTGNEMTNLVNQASCRCGTPLAARVFLNNNTGTAYNANDRVYVYVGTSCSEAQVPNSVYDPCVVLNVGPANEFDDQGKLLAFDQVWLSSGATQANQDISSAEPRAACPSSQTGTGKIWICVDADGNSQCLNNEFITPTVINSMGDTSTPSPDGMDGTQQPAGDGINYDYLPPQNSITGFRSSAGDGKVRISWDRAEVNDTSGFRILCTDQSGAPVKSEVTGVPSGQARTNGTLYYTAENLCDEPVHMSSDVQPPPPMDPGTEETTGGSSGTMGLYEDWQGDGWLGGGVGMTTGTGTDGSTGVSTTGNASTGGSDTEGSDTGGTGGSGSAESCDGSSSPLCSLDWAYVCTDHIPPGTVNWDVTGLRNGETYDFLVVAYDRSGNPRIASPEILTDTPRETTDFWEQCELQGEICGSGGFCHCRTGSTTGAGFMGLLLLLLARRRRSGR